MAQRPLAHDVFDHFPHGILVFDRAGEIVAANKATVQLLGPIRRNLDGPLPRCCDLFGCDAEGVLEGVCLTALAARASGPLPDIRVDLPSITPAQAVWVTAAPFSGNEGHFLIEVRIAAAHDRRRRTQPHWMGDARLQVFALGRTRLESREGPIGGKWLEQRAGQLFKYMVCHRRRVVYPEEIAGAIWPNEDAHLTGTVRYFVHRLRRHLEPEPPEHGPSSFLIAAEGGYRLASSVEVDADEFERHVERGMTARAHGDSEGAVGQLERAVALYQGDLISDQPSAPWVFDERERLRGLADQALRQLLQMDLERPDLDSALARLRRLVQMEPLDLKLQRQLLTLCLECGRRSEAMRRYTMLKAQLRNEFKEELDFELAELTS